MQLAASESNETILCMKLGEKQSTYLACLSVGLLHSFRHRRDRTLDPLPKQFGVHGIRKQYHRLQGVGATFPGQARYYCTPIKEN